MLNQWADLCALSGRNEKYMLLMPDYFIVNRDRSIFYLGFPSVGANLAQFSSMTDKIFKAGLGKNWAGEATVLGYLTTVIDTVVKVHSKGFSLNDLSIHNCHVDPTSAACYIFSTCLSQPPAKVADSAA